MNLRDYPLRLRVLHATRYSHMWTTDQLVALVHETRKEGSETYD